jgi:tetratricopeptide (TPR) repeat protein
MSTPKYVCTGCHRPAQPNRARCMYCGAPVTELHTAIIDPDEPNVAAAVAAKIDEVRRARPAAALAPAEREALFEAAKAKIHRLLDADHHEGALAAFDEALAIVPSPHLFLAKGQLLKGLKRPGPALAALDQALAADRALAEAWFEKADILETLGQLPQSLAAYDACLQIEPRNARAHCDRGHVLGRMGRLPDAVRAYEAALAADPRSPHAWFNKGNAEAAIGQTARARDSFQRFLALDPPPQLRALVDHARGMLAKLGG